jgi:hypothetical protein
MAPTAHRVTGTNSLITRMSFIQVYLQITFSLLYSKSVGSE